MLTRLRKNGGWLDESREMEPMKTRLFKVPQIK